MGLFDDFFGGGSEPEPRSFMDDVVDVFSFGGSTPEPTRPGIFDGMFGGSFSQSSTPIFGGQPGEPVLPFASSAKGYGDSYHSSVTAAQQSTLMQSGIVTDPDTDYTGTPTEILARYRAEGRDPSKLLKRYRRR